MLRRYHAWEEKNTIRFAHVLIRGNNGTVLYQPNNFCNVPCLTCTYLVTYKLSHSFLSRCETPYPCEHGLVLYPQSIFMKVSNTFGKRTTRRTVGSIDSNPGSLRSSYRVHDWSLTSLYVISGSADGVRW